MGYIVNIGTTDFILEKESAFLTLFSDTTGKN
jgi:hypothetical protein